MKNKGLLLVFFCCIAIKALHSQTIRHPAKKQNAGCYNCNSVLDWQDITNNYVLNSSPFNKIFHLSFKRINDVVHYATTSFVSNDLLVTARHVVDGQESLEYIELNLPSFKNQWVKLTKKDYKIYYYTENFNKGENDIALIRIINKQKLKLLYSGHFEIVDSQNRRMGEYEVNVSGFPVNKFAINSVAPDTLVNRALSSQLLEFNPSNTMIGLPACVCNGDSGGPIWIRNGNRHYILGVNQGSKSTEQGFKNPNLNIAVFINDTITKWIKSIREQHF